MILKEAFRMQNHLYDLSMEAKLFLSRYWQNASIVMIFAWGRSTS